MRNKIIPGICITAAISFCATQLLAQGIVITPGAHVTGSNGSSPLHVIINNASILNNGTIYFQEGSTLRYRGNAPTASSGLGGSGQTYLANLEIDKTMENAALTGNIYVLGDLQLSSGHLRLNNNTLDLSYSGTILNENDSHCVSGINGGQVIRRIFLSGPTGFNPGNIGFEISTNQYMGNSVIRRKYGTINLTPTETSINRYYEISADYTSGMNANVKLYYLDEDLNGANENDLFVWSTANNPNNWSYRGRDNADNTLKFVEKGGIDVLARFTLNEQKEPSRTDQFAFRATLQDNNGLLEWEATDDRNNLYYDVQRSFDGKNFFSIGQLKSNPATDVKNSYAFTDKAMLIGRNVYRLKITDKKGSYSYSDVRVLQLQEHEDKILSVYPLPSNDRVYITLYSGLVSGTSFTVFDVNGKPIMKREIMLDKGFNKIELSLNSYPDGTYQVRFNRTGLGSVKLIKKQ